MRGVFNVAVLAVTGLAALVAVTSGFVVLIVLLGSDEPSMGLTNVLRVFVVSAATAYAGTRYLKHEEELEERRARLQHWYGDDATPPSV